MLGLITSNLFDFHIFMQVHVYTLNGSSLSPKKELKHLGAITDCAFSPNDEYLVACDTYRKLILYKVPEFEVSRRRPMLVRLVIKLQLENSCFSNVRHEEEVNLWK